MVRERYGTWVPWWVSAMVSEYYVEWWYRMLCYGDGAMLSCTLVSGCYGEWVLW